jgi:hypothetical protein
MTDFSNSVIIPREDFIELQTVAFDNQHDTTVGERIGTIIQTTTVLAGVAGAFAAASWGWAKAMDWYETKQHERKLAEKQFDIDNPVEK